MSARSLFEFDITEIIVKYERHPKTHEKPTKRFLNLYSSIFKRLLKADGIFVISVTEMIGNEVGRHENYV